MKMESQEETSVSNRVSTTLGSAESRSTRREPDALYQRGALVARVSGAEVDTEACEVRIDEVYRSDSLVIPEECEFQDFRIQIQSIQFASKIDTAASEKGRVLRGVIADILGTREP
jgi:hypothetical protein